MKVRRRREACVLLLVIVVCASQVCGCGSGVLDSSRIERIGEALLNYRDTYRSLPPAAILDADGRPMHSWRVLIVPFIEANGFFDRYDFESSWDETDNLALTLESTRFEGEKFEVPSMVSDVYGPAGSGHTTKTCFLAVCANAKVENADSNPRGGWGDDLRFVHSRPRERFIVVELASTPVGWTEPSDVYVSSDVTFPTIEYADVRDDVIRAIKVGEDFSVLDRDEALELIDSLARENE
jgi:hypothetical protein